MHFPSFLFPMLFGAILLLVVLFVVIFAVVCYINKAMKEEKIYPKIAARFKMVMISTTVILFIGIIPSLFMGYKIGYNRFEESINHFSANDIETYYAEVKAVSEDTITVAGISLSEEKYHQEFCYQISSEVSIICGDEQISLTDLENGDLVSITLVTGKGHLIGITDIFKITLLNSGKSSN